LIICRFAISFNEDINLSAKEKNTESVRIAGVVERVVFHSADTGFSVIKLKSRSGKVVDVVGDLGARNPGERLKLKGRWELDKQWGYRFKVESFEVEEPDDVDSLKKYLASDLVEGIGEAYAEKLVEHFGSDVLEIIREHPERLREVPGIGKKRAQTIQNALTADDREKRIIRELSLKLLDHGIGPAKIRKIYHKYKGAALDILSRDPYRLADEMSGIGFRIADKIAAKMSVPKDSPSRIRAGILFTLKKASEEGHCYMPREALVERAGAILGIDARHIGSRIDELSQDAELASEGDRIYLPKLARAEKNSAELLMKLTSAEIEPLGETLIERGLDAIERRKDILFTNEQRGAVHTALAGATVSVITGGPGTGKTTVIEAIVTIALQSSLRPALCAPTGRAANRLVEATGRQASTIHRLLEYTPGTGFKLGHGRPIPAEIIILDEASMVDIELLESLLFAIKPGSRLVIVGDPNQLPSVGPGQVLGDIIACGRISTVALETIHRQAENSRIIAESYSILRGKMPRLRNNPHDDFFFIAEEDREQGLQLVVDLVSRRLPVKYALDPARDIQVIVPMYKGICGANALNEALRLELNLAGAESDARFFPGDKVMQTRNNYDLNIFNGDIGFVESVAKDSLVVDFGRPVVFDKAGMDDLSIAYAITAHKSQGGEVPCVVIPIYREHFMLLNRNLLYTAITRAKRLCVIVGQASALGIAVGRSESRKRWTALAQRLVGDAPGGMFG